MDYKNSKSNLSAPQGLAVAGVVVVGVSVLHQIIVKEHHLTSLAAKRDLVICDQVVEGTHADGELEGCVLAVVDDASGGRD